MRFIYGVDLKNLFFSSKGCFHSCDSLLNTKDFLPLFSWFCNHQNAIIWVVNVSLSLIYIAATFVFLSSGYVGCTTPSCSLSYRDCCDGRLLSANVFTASSSQSLYLYCLYQFLYTVSEVLCQIIWIRSPTYAPVVTANFDFTQLSTNSETRNSNFFLCVLYDLWYFPY